MAYVSHIECFKCKERFEAGKVYNQCEKCAGPLSVRYDLDRLRNELRWRPEDVAKDNQTRLSMWRYSNVLPVRDPANIVSLGEGISFSFLLVLVSFFVIVCWSEVKPVSSLTFFFLRDSDVETEEVWREGWVV